MPEEKNKSKKKFPKLEELKKSIIISGIILAGAITAIVIGINIYSEITEPDVTFVLGTRYVPNYIDPLRARSVTDIELIDQVAEGLFDYNYSSELFKPIPNLAERFEWSKNATELTCYLRRGVTFHDGTPFNAQAVKWTFERIYRLIDHENFAVKDLWTFQEGKPIINDTQVIEDYIVKFILNGPYAPLQALMSSWSSYILSPTSTPADEFIDVLTGDLVGTGPFIYDNYEFGFNLTMSSNQNYWGGKPKIDKLIFLEIDNNPARVEALLSGKIHMFKQIYFNESTLNIFRNNSSFTVQEEIINPDLQYFIMNNKLINTTMRKAISYAINYTSWIDELKLVRNRAASRANSLVPEVVIYHNTTGINVPYYNISIARQALKDVNWSGIAGALTADDNISAGNEWEKLVDDGTPLATYNFTYFGWRGLFSPLLTENLKQIGVKVESFGISMGEWSAIADEEPGFHKNMFELTIIGWAADFNDPSTMINPLCSNKSSIANDGQVNDPIAQEWMEEALVEMNDTAREQLYYKIQKQLIEEVFPYAWIYSSKRTDIYVSNLRGWYPNPFKLVFKSVYFI